MSATRTAIPVLLLLAAPLTAQLHERDPLIRGQDATFSFTGMPASSFGVMLISAQAGPGPCLPNDACFGILPPFVAGPLLFTDATGADGFTVRVAPNSTLFEIATQAVVANPSDPMNQFVFSNAVDGSVVTLAYYNEVFDGDGFRPDWQFYNPARFTAALDGAGNLRLVPTTAGAAGSWNDADEGGMMYREIRGDFIVSTRIQGLDGPGGQVPPAINRRLGGLIARDPNAVAPDWVAIGIGSGDTLTPHSLTAIDTSASVSTYTDYDQSIRLTPIEAELRLVRAGNTIRCEYRNNPVVPFATLATATRASLAPVLQVGLFVSSLDSPPSVAVELSEVRWEN